MGTCCGNQLDDNTKYIDWKLQENEKIERQTVKLLFLGPGGSGKSTIFKQLQWLHGGGYTEEDAKLLREDIHCQAIRQMQECIEHYLLPNNINNITSTTNTTNLLPIDDESVNEIKDDQLHESMNVIREYKNLNKMTSEISNCIHYIWQNHEKCKGIFKLHHSKKILDETTEYFWNDIERISNDDYIPNKQDIINVRYRTTGIIEKRFVIHERSFHIFDVGGQKSERKKWVQCFDDVTAVIFVASLACYNELMYEDGNKNCMVDALELFNKTINLDHFDDTPFILFLNKRDLFENKIRDIAITICPAFDDFDINAYDENDYEDTIKYIQNEFKLQRQNKNKSMYIHVTCAMDERNVKIVFHDVTEMFIRDVLSDMHMV